MKKHIFLNLIVFLLPSSLLASPAMQLIDGFLIDKTEVTVGQFKKFVDSTGYTTSAEKNGGGLIYNMGWKKISGWVWHSPYGRLAASEEPAVRVSFYDAEAFCKWKNKRIPTDIEWHKAAYTEFRSNPPMPYIKGVSYPYPTGNTPHGANCLKECGDLATIYHTVKLNRGYGHVLAGTTLSGVNGLYEMGANVWEWTESGRDHEKGTRGGSWWYGASKMRSDNQSTKSPSMAAIYIGFRCVKSLNNK